MKHQLKTWPQFFERIANGSKTFELRQNDRDFQAGEILELREWAPRPPGIAQLFNPGGYTGRTLFRKVGYTRQVGTIGVQIPVELDGWVVMSLLPVEQEEVAAYEQAQATDCRHEESLYGRCTACGKTWEQQQADAEAVAK